MNKTDKVSVVIPTHKRPGTLKRALESVFAQTYPCQEVIVVSDGLDQETDVMMKAMVWGNPVLQYYVVDPPQGANHARNVGIHHATGSHIAFLDDDDEWLSEKIARQMKIMAEDSSIGLVCTAIKIVNNDGELNWVSTPGVQYDASTQILYKNHIGTTSSVLITRAVLDQSGLFDESMRAQQDYELWIRICQVTKVGVVKEPSLLYYDDPFSTQISRDTSKYIEAVHMVFRKHEALFLSRMSPRVFQLRKAEGMLAISKRAKRNGQTRLAWKYACKTLALGGVKVGVKACLLNLIPLSVLIFLYKRLNRFSTIRRGKVGSA